MLLLASQPANITLHFCMMNVDITCSALGGPLVATGAQSRHLVGLCMWENLLLGSDCPVSAQLNEVTAETTSVV